MSCGFTTPLPPLPLDVVGDADGTFVLRHVQLRSHASSTALFIRNHRFPVTHLLFAPASPSLDFFWLWCHRLQSGDLGTHSSLDLSSPELLTLFDEPATRSRVTPLFAVQEPEAVGHDPTLHPAFFLCDCHVTATLLHWNHCAVQPSCRPVLMLVVAGPLHPKPTSPFHPSLLRPTATMDSTSPRPGRDSPSDPSPTDTRQPSLSSPITRDDDWTLDSLQSTDTVRRRPAEGGHPSTSAALRLLWHACSNIAQLVSWASFGRALG